MRPLRLYIDVPRIPEFLEIPAEALTALNYQLMRVAADNGAEFPPLYGSGIVYRREPPGREWWESALELVELGEGDCEDLAAYRAAELRFREAEPARVRIYRTRRNTYHAIVERGDGSFEDPARIVAQLESTYAGTFPHVK
jgi:hypothetical protein